jgi:tetratricopeptide (TPR) repeat protein
MPSRKDSTNRSETFGRLLSGAINSIATYEGKTAPIIEEELGTLAIVAGKTIQRYKSGHLPPEPRTIEILADAAIRRGYLGREWLQRFLHAARYPFADKLLNQLCPIGPARQRPPRVYENLPAPTYSQFVMRQQPFDEVIDGLRQRSSVVLIVGLGGNGKTSLAREVAARCLQNDGAAPQFDAVVWVSDKDQPGTTNLSVVLDEIARTLDYPGFTQFAHEEKRREVEQLLRRQRVLIVVDNFETIADSALLSWLLRLPEPSKAIVTSREKHRDLWSSWLAELRGMSEAEAQTLIHQRLRMLQLDKMVKELTDFEPLVTVTGGNPKAIEIALGLIKYERCPLQQMMDDLYAACGELFDDLFARAWALLDETARRVLLVATFFPISANAEALSATADVQRLAFDRAVERMVDLALLDEQRIDMTSMARFTLHPLVRSFARARIAETSEYEKGARQQWIKWCVSFAETIEYQRNDLSALSTMDSEYKTVVSVLEYASNQRYYSEVISIARRVRSYYYVRGFWDIRLLIDRQCEKSAINVNDIENEIVAIVAQLQVMSLQGDTLGAESLFARVVEIENSDKCSQLYLSTLYSGMAWYWMAHRNFDLAEVMWLKALNSNDLRSGSSFIIHRHSITHRHWLALCKYRGGKTLEAQHLFQEVLKDSRQVNYLRSIYFCLLELAEINLDQDNSSDAAKLLESSREYAGQYSDRPCLARIQRAYARLHILCGDLPAARIALAESIDLFERLGMRRELAEARAALTDLDAREPAEAAG